MPLYLSVDAGGSKCAALLYDDALTVLGRGMAGGVNPTQGSAEDAEQHFAECLRQTFSACPDAAIDAAYTSVVGAEDVFLRLLPGFARVGSIVPLSEPVAGLYAGALRTEGVVALSGTGSDVFCVQHGGQTCVVVGGWGPILGDEGSGAWLGQNALRAAVRAMEGWGEPTALCALVREAWHVKTREEFIDAVHKNPAPFRKAASATRLLGQAARQGDAASLSILREGGELLARQTLRVIELARPSAQNRVVVCCGGAWKTHAALFDAFRARLLSACSDLKVVKPLFEPVLAGAARLLLERGVSPEQARPMLAKAFPEAVISW